MTTKIKDIRYFYRFKPSVKAWITKRKGRSFLVLDWQETWYGGSSFVAGFSTFIQFRAFAIHIRVEWWNLKF